MLTIVEKETPPCDDVKCWQSGTKDDCKDCRYRLNGNHPLPELVIRAYLKKAA